MTWQTPCFKVSFICNSALLFTYLFIYFFIYLLLYLFIHLFIFVGVPFHIMLGEKWTELGELRVYFVKFAFMQNNSNFPHSIGLYRCILCNNPHSQKDGSRPSHWKLFVTCFTEISEQLSGAVPGIHAGCWGDAVRQKTPGTVLQGGLLWSGKWQFRVQHPHLPLCFQFGDVSEFSTPYNINHSA